jgi:hypothetical protein
MNLSRLFDQPFKTIEPYVFLIYHDESQPSISISEEISTIDYPNYM